MPGKNGKSTVPPDGQDRMLADAYAKGNKQGFIFIEAVGMEGYRHSPESEIPR